MKKRQNKAIAKTLRSLENLLGLQRELDEANRLLGDIFMTLHLRRCEAGNYLVHDNEWGRLIFNELYAVLKENRELKLNKETTDPQQCGSD